MLPPLLACPWPRLGVLAAVLAVVGAASASRAVAAPPPPIVIDGQLDDWGGVAPLATDPVGDVGPGDIDLGTLAVSNDSEALYVRLELGRETILQNPPGSPAANRLTLYLDADADAATGTPLLGMGVDLAVEMGPKIATWHSAGGPQELSLNDIGLTSGPTHSGETFEFRLPFSFRPGFGGPGPLIAGPAVRLAIAETLGGDALPDAGFVDYALATEAPPVLVPIPFDKIEPTDIRILVHNVLQTRPASNPGPFERYLAAFQPDIVNFEEMYNLDAEATRLFVEGALPSGAGESWHVAKVQDCATLSRWPIVAQAESDGNLVCYIDLPDARSRHDLVVINAHTPCCNGNAGRDVEHDRMSALWRDLMSGAGPFAIRPDDAVVMVGDFNMVGFVRQLRTLRDGDIIDEAVFGADFAPGRAIGSLASAPLRHTHTRSAYTWRDDENTFAPGKLDYVLFSADAMTLRRNFALFTPEIPLDVLNAAGLLATDSTDASDHCVLVADFAFEPAEPVVESALRFF